MIYSFTELSKEFKEIEHIKKNFDNVNRYSSLYSFFEYLWNNARARAKLRKREYTILIQDLYDLYKSQNGLCALSGIKLTYSKRNNKRISPYNISIDRIDSSKGYTKDNIHLVCASINSMKLDYSVQEFIELCKQVYEFNR